MIRWTLLSLLVLGAAAYEIRRGSAYYIAVAVMLVVLILVAAAAAPGARATRRGKGIVVAPRGLNVLWACHGTIDVPVASVTAVTVVSGREAFRYARGIRAPGTSIPGLFAAGTFRWRGDKNFVLARRGHPATVIELAGHRFDHIVVETADDVAALVDQAHQP